MLVSALLLNGCGGGTLALFFDDCEDAMAQARRELGEPEKIVTEFIDLAMEVMADQYEASYAIEARGDAERIVQAAEGYKQQVVNDATGQTSRFTQVYDQSTFIAAAISEVKTSALIGGLLADRYLGSKRSVKFGAVLMALAGLLMRAPRGR